METERGHHTLVPVACHVVKRTRQRTGTGVISIRPAGDKDVELCSKRLKRSLIFQEITLHNKKIFHCYVHSWSLRPFPLAGSEGHLGTASKYFPALCKMRPHAGVCLIYIARFLFVYADLFHNLRFVHTI